MNKVWIYSIVGVLIMGIFFSGGCTKKRTTVTKNSAKEKIEENLSAKYGEEFSVNSIKNVNTVVAGMAGKQVGFEAQVTDSKNNKFSVFADNNAEGIKDKYGEALFKNDIKDFVLNKLSTVSDIDVNYRNAIFFFEDGNWSNSGVDDFLRESSTYVCFNVDLDVLSAEDAVNKVKEIERILDSYNIKFMTTFKYNNESMTYSKTTEDSEIKTNEEILNEFLR